MRQVLLVLAIMLAGLVGLAQAHASIQDDTVCLEPDVEFPVPCDED